MLLTSLVYSSNKSLDVSFMPKAIFVLLPRRGIVRNINIAVLAEIFLFRYPVFTHGCDRLTEVTVTFIFAGKWTDLLQVVPRRMRFLGLTSRLLKNVRPQTKHFTPHYRNFAQYVNLMPTSPIIIMADSLKSSLPQTRVLSESEVDEPAHKKPRLDDHSEGNIDSAMEDPIASTSQPTKDNGSKRMKRKNKKKSEAPLPELCSAPDVLYQEIRSILGADVVDAITLEGGAFKSPYSRGDEVEVTIDRMTAGGKFKVLCM